jgi:DNA-binding response OmpR family regulator
LTKVLLAEHELDLLGLYASDLERNGFAVVTARDGKEAVARFLEESPPEIAIVDYDLPKISGHDVVLKILTLRPQAKIIMLTKRGSDVEEAERIGLEIFLLKPVSAQTMVKSVRALATTRAKSQMVIVTR